MKKLKLVSLTFVAAVLLSVSTLLLNIQGVDLPVVQAQESKIVLKSGYFAAHGEQSFTSIVVAMQDDKVVDVVLDEFQFVDAGLFESVPNGNKTFGDNFPEGKILISKIENSDEYSQLMKEKADSTVEYDDNFEAIEDFAINKTMDELKSAIEDLNALGENDNVSDVVTGATLVDTPGYLSAIVNIIENGLTFDGAVPEGEVELEQKLLAVHGDQSFALITVAKDEQDRLVGAAMDELEYLEGDQWEAVPNGEKEFGDNFPEGRVLASKLTNNEAYSAVMAEQANSTVSYMDNYTAIIKSVLGKTKEEIEDLSKEAANADDNISDVITGATLVNTPNYLNAIVDVLD